MSFQITLLPSGKIFQAEAKESVLQAALSSGLNLGYHCNSGSCGECQVVVKSGHYEPYQNADFPLTEAQKSQGYALLCSMTAVSDMEIQALEAKTAADIPIQYVTAKVSKFQPLQDDFYELSLRTPRSSTLRFLAGQTVRLQINNDRWQLPIASCPCNGMNLQFHLDSRTPTGLTQQLLSQTTAPSKIKLEGPYGGFTLRDDSPRASVFVAFGLGFAAIKSLIEHAIALEKEQSLSLFWIMPESRSHYQSNYCRAWEDAFDGFVYLPMTAENDAPNRSVFEALAQKVLARSPLESELDLYLAGPLLMIQTFRKVFKTKRTPAERIHAFPTD